MKAFNDLVVGDKVFIVIYENGINNVCSTEIIDVRGVKAKKVQVKYRKFLYVEKNMGQMLFINVGDATEYAKNH